MTATSAIPSRTWTLAAPADRNPLREAVSVSERVKEVARLAAEIDIAAINASLAARQGKSGGKSGFAVVAKELRDLSRRLQTSSNEIVDTIFVLVDCTARILRQQRTCQILDHVTGEAIPLRQAEVRNTCWSGIARLRAEAETHWDVLESTVQRIHEACRLGAYLAHCARVEATQGGAIAMRLHQVAADIDASFVQITQRMKQISTARRS